MEMMAAQTSPEYTGCFGLTFDDLRRLVIGPGACMKCGACVAACPVDILAVDEEEASDPVSKKGECITCGLCLAVCPTIEGWELGEGDLIGPYIEMFVARAADMPAMAQDGGVATVLLETAFKEGVIDSALVVERSPEGWKGTPVLVRRPEELRKYSGTLYWQVPVLSQLDRFLEKEGVQKLAVVGMPCRLSAVQLIQENIPDLSNKISLKLALFCSEAFDRGPSLKHLHEATSLTTLDMKSVDIKGRVVIEKPSGEVVHSSLKKLKQFACSSCSFCKDYTGEISDVSLGAVGVPKPKHNVVVVRSEVGRSLVEKAVSEGRMVRIPEPVQIEALNKLILIKKRQAKQRTLAAMRASYPRNDGSNLNPHTVHFGQS